MMPILWGGPGVRSVFSAAALRACGTPVPRMQPASDQQHGRGLAAESKGPVRDCLCFSHWPETCVLAASGLNQMHRSATHTHHIFQDVLPWPIRHALSYPIKGRTK